MVVHTFGDSHCEFGWDSIKEVQVHHLGPRLCFSIGRDGINIKDGYNVNNGDTVIFSFGEIDCRAHVHKHITEENSYKQIIDYIVHHYFIQIQNAVNAFDNLKTVIYNIVPPVEKTEGNGGAPFLGTSEERKSYVLYFNEKLKEKCIEYKFLFFDIYDKYTDSNGFLDMSMSDYTVHIGSDNGKEIHIRKFYEDNLL